MTEENNTRTVEEQKLEKESPSQLTTGNNSTEKLSPSHNTTSAASALEDEDVRVTENSQCDESPISDDDEIEYPGTLTKVLVGIGLALAVFLVPAFLATLGYPDIDIMNLGCVGSDDCSHCHSKNFRSFPFN